MRSLDLNKELDRILDFIRNYLHSSGFEKVVLGLSGGVDSAVTAALAVRALGRHNVIAAMMPYVSSHPDSLNDALKLAEQLKIEARTVLISPLVDYYFDEYDPQANSLRRGNWMARLRMNVLYDLTAKEKALVIGTSNRTELLVGYFTQFGDSACAFEPIGHLYKTEVWQLAALLGIPEKIITKIPTADLWQGQTDEADLGMRYAELDEIIYELTELDLDLAGSLNLKYPREQYQKVERMIRASAFKRQLPPVLE